MIFRLFATAAAVLVGVSASAAPVLAPPAALVPELQQYVKVADGKNWADPPLELFSPPLDFPTNGANPFSTKGLAFECKWNNPTPNMVKFGEGFNDEMCFLWQYYFPSQGFQVCMGGFCKKSP